MLVRINGGKLYMNLREKTTVADALRLLELTLCRDLKRPLHVVLNGKMLVEGTCRHQKVRNEDALEITESVQASKTADPRFLVKSKSLTRHDMTRSASLRRNLLRSDVLDEYRRKVLGVPPVSSDVDGG